LGSNVKEAGATPTHHSLQEYLRLMSDTEEYWFCLTHHTVEGHEGCRNQDRLGPYPTREQAGRALDLVQERNDDWDNDPAWNDDAPPAP
jgi:hypothetical protein